MHRGVQLSRCHTPPIEIVGELFSRNAPLAATRTCLSRRKNKKLRQPVLDLEMGNSSFSVKPKTVTREKSSARMRCQKISWSWRLWLPYRNSKTQIQEVNWDDRVVFASRSIRSGLGRFFNTSLKMLVSSRYTVKVWAGEPGGLCVFFSRR